MNGLHDCYVLAPERSAALATKFLDNFVPLRQPSFAPEEPSEVLGCAASSDIEDVLIHLEAKRKQAYSLYFRNLEDCDPLHAAVVFNEDGSLVLMLSISATADGAMANVYVQKLQAFCGARLGYWGWEEPPAPSALAFEERAKREPT